MVSALRNSIVLTRESRLTGTVFKILDTRQSEILTDFHENFHSNLLRVLDLCVEIPSKF